MPRHHRAFGFAILALSLCLLSFWWEEFGKFDMCTAPPAPTRSLRTEGENFTVMLTVNAGFIEFFHAWHVQYKKLSLPFDVLVVAEDDSAYGQLRHLYPDVVVERCHINGSPGASAFGSLEYRQLMAARPTHMLRHLRAGRDLIFTDADAFWLSDPLQHFSPDYDVWMPVEKPLNWPLRTHAFHNAGFMGVRSNRRTIRLIEAWERELLRIGPSRNQRVLHELLTKDATIRLQSLPHMYFPSGTTYFRRGCTAKAVVVHVNGGLLSGTAAKRSALQQIGLWADRGDNPIRPPASLQCVDYVVLSNAPLTSCILRASVSSLWKHARPTPCRVLLISAGDCRGAPKEVVCVNENAIVPGLSVGAVRDNFTCSFRTAVDRYRCQRLRGRAGWLLQQLLKLGLASFREDLTEHFVIWDSDNVLLRPTVFFDEELRGVARMHGTNSLHGRDTLEPYLHKASGSILGVHNTSKLGAVTPSARLNLHQDGCDYAWVFHQLSGGLPMLVPTYERAHMSSFVTHYMAARRATIKQMVDLFAREGVRLGLVAQDAPIGLPTWVVLIIRLMRDKCGFSEYASVLSWVMQRNPEQVRFLPQRDWVRVENVAGVCPTSANTGQYKHLSYISWEQNGGSFSYSGGIQNGWEFKAQSVLNAARAPH